MSFRHLDAGTLASALACGIVALPQSSGSQETTVQIEGRYWTIVERCYKPADFAYGEQLAALAQRALNRSDQGVGCVTGPYLERPYDQNGALRIWNDAHAGLDLRASGDAVHAVEAGSVVRIDYCPPPGSRDEACGRGETADCRCETKDKEPHSTLIIEDHRQVRKTLYLHMATMAKGLRRRTAVSQGQLVGTAGKVGANAPHLHLQVWPSDSPAYCSRQSAIAGSACPNKLPRGGRRDYCEYGDVVQLTNDPVDVVSDPAPTERPRGKRLETANDPLSIGGVGPVKIGMTMAEVETLAGSLRQEDRNFDCMMASPILGPGGLNFMFDGRTLVRIYVWSCHWRLANDVASVAIGDPFDPSKFPFAQRRTNREGEIEWLHEGSLAGQEGLGLLFGTKVGTKAERVISSISMGKKEFMGLVEGCH